MSNSNDPFECYVQPLRSRSNQQHVLCVDPYHNVDQYQSAAPLTRSYLLSVSDFVHCTHVIDITTFVNVLDDILVNQSSGRVVS
jgi:hypothetical protein